jgi:acyl-coenzyme A thioesterase PaaI-like protein
MAMDARIDMAEPIFARHGAEWQPHAEAGGPFGGLHGGAVSGLVVADMEREAAAQQLGQAMSASVLLLRPAPMATLETRSELQRKGSRVGVVETSLLADGKLIAKGTASFATAVAVTATPALPLQPTEPAKLAPWDWISRFRHKTLFDALDIRDDGNGTCWGRLRRPLAPFATPFADVFTVADCGTAFYLTGHGIQPRWSFPNLDLAVHVSRAPVGPWIGVRAQSDWRSDGRGLTQSVLFDEAGQLGSAAQSVVLIPHP